MKMGDITVFKPRVHSHTELELKCSKNWLPEHAHSIGKAAVVATHPRLSSLVSRGNEAGLLGRKTPQ